MRIEKERKHLVYNKREKSRKIIRKTQGVAMVTTKTIQCTRTQKKRSKTKAAHWQNWRAKDAALYSNVPTIVQMIQCSKGVQRWVSPSGRRGHYRTGWCMPSHISNHLNDFNGIHFFHGRRT